MIKTLLSLETFGKQSHDWHTPWTWSQIFFLAIKNCSGVTYFLWCSIVCLSQVKGNVQKLNKHSCMSRFSSLSYSLWQVFFFNVTEKVKMKLGSVGYSEFHSEVYLKTWLHIKWYSCNSWLEHTSREPMRPCFTLTCVAVNQEMF